MTEKTASRHRRAVAAAGAAVLGFAGLFGASAAQAAPVDPQPSYGDIIADATGSITVHKHENQVGSPVHADPAGPATPLPNPIEGATFTAYLINDVDLTTPEGWTKVNGATVTNCDVTGDGISRGAAVPGTHTTDSDGITVFEDLEVGAYLICETGVPANVATSAQPFIVTIPFPDNQTTAPSNSNGWLYDVHVYPKNTLKTEVTKSIELQEEFGLGSTVVFPITATVPRIPDDEVFTEFSFVDEMDSRLEEVKVESVTVDGAAVDSGYYEQTADGTNPVKVWFNADGLAWLKTQGGKSVVVTLSGIVAEIGDGTVANTADYRITHGPGTTPPNPEEPEPCDPDEEDCGTTPPVHTNWGDLKLQKVDAANTDATLEGAKFQVFAANDPYAADCSTTEPAGAAISVDGETEFTSNELGIVSIAGLFVSDSVNPVIDAAYRCYWVEETVAPAGYVLPGDAWISVQVVKGATTAAYDYQIENSKTTVPELPLTGAQGQLLMVAGGIVLIALGATLYAVRRRQVARR